jgi:C-terminal processing protease CtpA/Prc
LEDGEAVEMEKRREVMLVRGASGLGLKIASNDDQSGVYICEVTPGGAAEDTGAVFVGDVIAEVNGQNMLEASHDVVVAALMSASPLSLTLLKGPVAADSVDGGFANSLVKVVGAATADSSEDGGVGDLLAVVVVVCPPPSYGSGASRNGSFIHSGSAAHPGGGGGGATSAAGSSASFALPQSSAVAGGGSNSSAAESKCVDGVPVDVPSESAPLSNRRRVFMSRRSNGFGMKIRSDPGIRGVRVSDISAGGAAAAAGNVYVGDFILEINDTPMLYASHDDVVGALLKSSDVLLLLGTEHDSYEYACDLTSKQAGLGIGERTVMLQRTVTGLGMKIKSDEGVRGVRIIDVTLGGAADRSGLVQVGDVIVCVNGAYMLDKPHSAVVDALTANEDEIELTLASEDAISQKEKEKKKKAGLNSKFKKFFSSGGKDRSADASGGAGSSSNNNSLLADMPPEALAALREIAAEDPVGTGIGIMQTHNYDSVSMGSHTRAPREQPLSAARDAARI